MTKPEKQDGTMELDVNQIDLLDLPLPPRSKPELEGSELRGSKGPPPLPPAGADAPIAPSLPTAEAPEEPPVPSLVLPEPSKPRLTPAAPVSARKLVGAGPAEDKSPVVRFLFGMGAATIVCALAYVGFRQLHKTPAAPAPSASEAPAPTHAFTMAPIEFTEPASSQEPAPSAHASASASPATAHPSSTAAVATTTTTATATHAPTSPSHAAPTTTGAKPPRTDELLKVEN